MSRVPEQTPPGRILVRGVNWLGDAVMTTPALQRLRERFPQAHIALLTREKLAALWRHHPSLDSVLTVSRRENPWTVGWRLQAERFDLACVLPGSYRSALEVWFAAIPRRVGASRSGRNWLLTETVAPVPGHRPMQKLSAREVKRRIRAGPARPPASSGWRHQMLDYLHLAAALGASPTPLAPRLEVTPEELQAAKALCRTRLEAGRPGAQDALWLGLNPGAAYGPAKQWPADRFAAVARQVAGRKPGVWWLLFGEDKDEELCAGIARAVGERALNLAGATSLRQLMALLKLCRVLLTNDSGPMHLAAAMGTPTVVPFGSTSPELTAPGLPEDPRHHILRAHAPCSPCFRRSCPIDLRCMNEITVEAAAAAVGQACQD